MPSLRRLKTYLPLIREIVRREMRGRYVGSVLGFFWSVIHPLLQLIIYTLVFGVFLMASLGSDTSLSGFALYLFCGLLPWNAFAETLNRSATSLLENANLIKNLHFPAKVIPIALTLNALLHQALGLSVLVLAAVLIQRGFHAASLLILPLLVLQFVFMLGIGLLVAPMTIGFRDLLQLLPVLSMMWMYITPLFYSESLVTNHYPRLRFLFLLNPMRYFVQMSRALLLDGQVPGSIDWLIITQMSLLTLLLGYVSFTRRHPRFADEL